jgi:arylsulfatase
VTGPNFFDRGFRITAHIDAWQPGHDGVLLAWGHRATGMSLFVKDARLHFDLNLGGRHRLVTADTTVTPGATALQVIVRGRDDEAVATLLVDGDNVGGTPLPQLIPGGMGLLPTQCGHNAPSPVSPQYHAPFRYRGGLTRVVIDLEPREHEPTEADWLATLTQQ